MNNLYSNSADDKLIPISFQKIGFDISWSVKAYFLGGKKKTKKKKCFKMLSAEFFTQSAKP